MLKVMNFNIEARKHRSSTYILETVPDTDIFKGLATMDVVNNIDPGNFHGRW